MSKARKSLKTALIISLIGAVILAYTFIEPYWIETKIYDIKGDIPNEFNNYKIVFLSDIHHGPYFSKDRVKKVVDKANKMDADLIILGGDYVHRNRKYIAPCFEELKNLKAKDGIYAVLGNHDHWEGKELSIQAIIGSDIRYIDNDAQWIYKNGSKIKIGGVGDYFEDKQIIGPTINDVSKEDFVILVSHNPDYVEDIKNDKIDLVLSGHTHGGQITLFGLWAPIIPSKYGQKYRTGIVNTEYTKVMVSNGIGTITPPVRFFARPQINQIILKPSEAKHYN
ncbi:metallophosphoesterase [Candidatus Poribacteria bacterium]